MYKKDNPVVILGLFETGLAVGRSIGRSGIDVVGLDFKKDIGFYSRYIRARICPHPLEEEDQFIASLIALGKTQKEKPVLFVTSDDFLASVSRNREYLEEYFLMNLPDEYIVESVTNKFQQYSLAQRSGIPVPKTCFPEDLVSVARIRKDLTYPVFVKANDVNVWRRQISGTTKGFLIGDEYDLMELFKATLGKGLRMIIQEVIYGPDTNHFKFCCYMSKEKKVLLSFTLQKIRQQPTRFGVGSVVRSVRYPELSDLGQRFFLAIGYRGVGSAEFKLDKRDGNLKLIELNPRYWQQNALSEKCGMNFPFVDYLETTGQGPEPVAGFLTGINWVNIYMDFNSYLVYQRQKELTLSGWLRSFKATKVLSDFACDDILPGFYEIRFGKRLLRLPRYLLKRLRDSNA